MSPICQHLTCECEAAPRKLYCSVYCENLDKGEALPGYGDLEGKCACGHAGCQHDVAVPEQEHGSISVGSDHP